MKQEYPQQNIWGKIWEVFQHYFIFYINLCIGQGAKEKFQLLKPTVMSWICMSQIMKMSPPAAEMLWICCSLEAKTMLIPEGGRFYHWTLTLQLTSLPWQRDSTRGVMNLWWLTASEWSLIFIPIWLQMPGQQKMQLIYSAGVRMRSSIQTRLL